MPLLDKSIFHALHWLLTRWLLTCWLLNHWLLNHWLLNHWLLKHWLLTHWLLNHWLLTHWLLTHWLLNHWLLNHWLMNHWLLNKLLLLLYQLDIGKDCESQQWVAGETVAVKSVDANSFRSIAQIDQIQDEISVLSGLKHPNIIRLLDMHFTNNTFYFVMEYAAGGDLVGYVRKQVGTPNCAFSPLLVLQLLLGHLVACRALQ